MPVKVAVLGAGINGLACAVKIKEKYKDFQVVNIANDFSPNTTADGAGGLWNPYLCGSTPEHLLAKWGGETYDFLHQLWRAGGYDVCLMPVFIVHRERARWREPAWASSVFGYLPLDDKYLSYLSNLYSTNYTAGHKFTTFVYTSTTFLRHLSRRFRALDGETQQAKLSSLQDPVLQPFDVVINCMGLGAREVVPDGRVFPIRGQVSKVIAPWLNESLLDEDSGHYILPNVHTCVLGGTHQEGDYNRKVEDKDTDFILTGCRSMVPSLQRARIFSHWTGLRPGRDEVRLEAEDRDGKLFIHNYGHGGSGLTLFWGCANDVLHLLDNHLSTYNVCKL